MIDIVNLNLPSNKRIKVIDCTKYNDMGICEDPLIKSFEKEVDGAYPTFFYEGKKLIGANTKEEIEAALNIFLEDDYIRKKYLRDSEGNYMKFNKDCTYINGAFGKKVVCA